MSADRGDCWEWDGYLGECVKWHAPHWWEYMNVWSISAVVVIFFASIALLFIAVDKWT